MPERDGSQDRDTGLVFELVEQLQPRTVVKIIGVGGGGSNAVSHVYEKGVGEVEFLVVDTDIQALARSPVPKKIAIGTKLTKGLGVGGDPEKGRQCALEDSDRLVDALEGAEVILLSSCFGGGTGTGATPVIANLARELDALTVAVITKPFPWEGPARVRVAEGGLAELANAVDMLISVPNGRLLELVPKGTGFFDALRAADDVLYQVVKGLSEIITTPGVLNRDLSDIRAIIAGRGHAVMGMGSARGENAAREATRAAISNPLLEHGGIQGAEAVLMNIAGSAGMAFHDVVAACELVREASGNPELMIRLGVVRDDSLADEVRVSVLATGFHRPLQAAVPARASEAAMTGETTQKAYSADDGVLTGRLRPASPLDQIPEDVQDPGEVTPPARPGLELVAEDELEVPAIFRRERKLFPDT